jgi:hypothetical protein
VQVRAGTGGVRKDHPGKVDLRRSDFGNGCGRLRNEQCAQAGELSGVSGELCLGFFLGFAEAVPFVSEGLNDDGCLNVVLVQLGGRFVESGRGTLHKGFLTLNLDGQGFGIPELGLGRLDFEVDVLEEGNLGGFSES